MNLSVIVPCYNEEENLPEIFKEFSLVFNKIPDVEVILVNNGSTDNSRRVFKELTEKYKTELFKVVEVPVNQGYGHGILTGLTNSSGSVLSWTHADLQTDPADVLKAYKLYVQLNDKMVFIKGRRKLRGLVADFFTKGMQITASLALQTSLEDIGAQPKLFSREFYLSYIKDKAPKDFSLDLFAQFMAKKHGKIVEFPVVMKKRLFGEAKGGGSWKTRIKVSKRTFRYIMEMRKNLN